MLTKHELNIVLKNPFFKKPFTESLVNYTLYQGKINASVLTVRFNITNQINENELVATLINSLMKHFSLNTRLLCSINYDLILSDHNQNSFYIWRANSNQTHYDIDEEMIFIFTYNNLYQIVQKATTIDMNSLNIYFANSNVVINKVISLVLSFVKI